MRHIWWIILLWPTGSASPQAPSDEGLRPYTTLWQHEQTDSLKSVLPQVIKKFPGKPETLFFAAVFESDGEKAAGGFLNIVTKYPSSYYADQSLLRLIQYDYALGQYQSANERVKLFEERYPQSPFLPNALAFGMKKTAIPNENHDNDSTESDERFTLQFGAFSQSKNATDLQAKLVSAGCTRVKTGEKTVNGKHLYTVTCGSFRDRERARQEGDRIKAKLNLTYTIVEK